MFTFDFVNAVSEVHNTYYVHEDLDGDETPSPLAYCVLLHFFNTFVTIYSNKLDMSARPLRYFFPYYAISAAYNSPIMHNGRLAQYRALKGRHSTKNIIYTFATIYSNKFDMSARPLRYFFPYYLISAAYNSPIMHTRLAQRRALK